MTALTSGNNRDSIMSTIPINASMMPPNDKILDKPPSLGA